MGKVIVMIHGRGPEPEHDALLACWQSFLDPTIIFNAASIDMVDYVSLWGYVPEYQPPDAAGCEKAATAANPDLAAQTALAALSNTLLHGLHLPFAHTALDWGDLQHFKDAAVEALWRQFARNTGNQFAIDVVNFFMDKPNIRVEARARLTAAVDAARANDHDVLVLAHSFGTVVAYEAARQYQHQEIDTLVTFGSPLAWCYDVWSPAAPPDAGYGRPKVFPDRGLRRWLNVYDALDPVATGVLVAAIPHLSPRYLNQGQQVVVDAAIANTYARDDDIGSHHDWRGYLASPPVAQIVRQFVA